MNSWPYPKVFAHRGGGTLAPENTLAAMKIGHSMGYKAVEFDVMLSSDGQPILMHDPEFGRTIQADGHTAQTSFKELITLDAGSWHSRQFAGEPVPSLDSIMDYCVAHQLAMNIEIKPSPGCAQSTGRVVAHALNHAYVRWPQLCTAALAPLVSSFSVDALEAFRTEEAHFDRRSATRKGLLVDRLPDDWFQQAHQLDCKSIHCNYRTLNAAIVRMIKQRGFWLFCYTVNEPTIAAELLSWGIDGFCTDRLDLFDPTL
jgi:glycerophosphoryl diester phosphodiesterase